MKRQRRIFSKSATLAFLLVLNAGALFSDERQNAAQRGESQSAVLLDEKNLPYKLDEIVSNEYAARLLSEGEITLVHAAGEGELALLPKSAYAEQARGNRAGEISKNNGYLIECLYLVEKSELVKNSASGATQVDTSLNAVSRIVRSISKMEGMTYISSITKSENVLYERTYTMAGADDDTPVPDKTAGDADGLVIYAYQRDTLLGGCKYRVAYHQTGNEIYMSFVNTTSMNFGFIKAVDAGRFHANMIIMDCGAEYLVYISGEAARSRIPLINDGINDAFYVRIHALYSWFVKQF